MSNGMSLVSIGLPVFNGEKFLTVALESVKFQTYGNLEVIISDNRSTDRTREICEAYSSQDKRFRYFCNKTNIGVAKNFNRVFELSSGKYFKWWAYDDLCGSQYIERCVEVLNKNPSAVVCHTKTSIIDSQGDVLGDYDDCLDFRSPVPRERFRDYLFRPAGMWNAIYGLIRVSEFKKTPLHGDYLGADQVLLGELVLRGKIYRIPDFLFFRRNHPQQFWRGKATISKMQAWFKPSRRRLFGLPIAWRQFYEYVRSIWRVGLRREEEIWCQYYLMKWFCRQLVKPYVKSFKNIIEHIALSSDGKEFKPERTPWDSRRLSK
jgi:glycosyltransferase involved in cell wall biosynthesis